jgi:hypothetical protein
MQCLGGRVLRYRHEYGNTSCQLRQMMISACPVREGGLHPTDCAVGRVRSDTEPVWLCCTWINCAMMAAAISKGDSAPRFKPIGAWILDKSLFVKPAADKVSMHVATRAARLWVPADAPPSRSPGRRAPHWPRSVRPVARIHPCQCLPETGSVSARHERSYS